MNRCSKVLTYSCFVLCSVGCSFESADKLTVAVATNFLSTAKELSKEFEENSDVKVTLVSGSSGQLFAQIKNGAPYDVFLSADQAKIDAVIDADLGKDDSRITYAIGRLCFMLNPKHEYELRAREHFETLSFNQIVLANPKLAPYGIAAEEVFDASEVDLLGEEKKVVLADNVGKTYAIVKSGNTDAGMVALSSILDDELSREHYYVIPEALYSPLRQDAIILKRTPHATLAREFLDFIQSNEARAKIRSKGYAFD